MTLRGLPLAERFAMHVDRSGSCHLFTLRRDRDGYGRIKVAGRTLSAHVVAWELANGPVPAGLEVDHTCHVRHCVRLEHLRLATRKQQNENRKGAQRNSKTGIRGVTVEGGRFRAWVGHNGRMIAVGYFDTADAASAAVAAKRAELFTHSAEADGRVAL